MLVCFTNLYNDNIMKSKFLLPAKYKKLGWILLTFGVLLGMPTVVMEWNPQFLDFKVLAISIDKFPNYEALFTFMQNNILNEILGISTIIGGLIVAFSREPDEDELILRIRLECLVWAIYWNYGILLIAFLFVYDFSFYWVMIFNMFTPLLLFVIRFNWLLSKFRKSTKNEE